MDIDYNTVFGLEAAGAEGTEVTEPSAEPENTGENVQETAEPAEQTGEDDRGKNTESASDTRQSGQTREQNAGFAAARRKAERERDAAIAKARADAAKDMDNMVVSLGIKDPETGKLLETKAEYDAYIARRDEEYRERLRRRSGMDEQELSDLVKGSAEYNEAVKRADRAEAELSQVRQREGNREVEEQLAEISRLNPEIRSIADLTKMETYPEFYRLVKENKMSFVQAYRLANYDSIVSEAESRGRQAALNNSSGKSHLGKTAMRGSGAAAVPSDVAAAYRVFNPNATDAEISAHYNSYLKK